MASITKDTIIGEILDMDQTTAPFFLEIGDALPGLPLFARRDSGASLRGPRRQRRRAWWKSSTSTLKNK